MAKFNAIHASLYKPVLFVGCERLPFTATTLIGGVIIMEYQTLLSSFLVFIGYLAVIALIRRINLEDIQFFQCLYRHIRFYADYYPVHAFYPGVKDMVRGVMQ